MYKSQDFSSPLPSHSISTVSAAGSPVVGIWITHIHLTLQRVLSHFSLVQLFANLWTVAPQAPLSLGFSRQEYWSGLPCLPPGELPDPGIERTSLRSPALASGFLTTSATLPMITSKISQLVQQLLSQRVQLKLRKKSLESFRIWAWTCLIYPIFSVL